MGPVRLGRRPGRRSLEELRAVERITRTGTRAVIKENRARNRVRARQEGREVAALVGERNETGLREIALLGIQLSLLVETQCDEDVEAILINIAEALGN